MLILGFDTSSAVLTVALGNEERILDEVTMLLPRGHMAKLIPVIDDLLTASGVTIHDVDRVVIGSGPGSYTGLRIGMVMARTFAQVLGAPILGVPSLDAIAHRNAGRVPIVCPIVDAKRGEVYTAIYRFGRGTVERLTDFRSLNPDELADILILEGFERILFAGDAVKLYAGVLSDMLGERAAFAPEDDWWPRASDLIELARPRLQAGDYDELYQLTPIYVRRSQAEEMWEKRHQGG